MPAINASYCVCKSGFKARADNSCEVITCPHLDPPDNGYFVKHPTGCGHVLNAACGARCKSGYQFAGSSIRLCQENGTWSGSEANCVCEFYTIPYINNNFKRIFEITVKTCPRMSIPYYGTVTCRNTDLNLAFDYTTRNDTFMKSYQSDELRITEPMPIDTDCNFKCGPGFYMVGSATRNCLPLSKWDGLQTTCKREFRLLILIYYINGHYNFLFIFLYRNIVSSLAKSLVRRIRSNRLFGSEVGTWFKLYAYLSVWF